ncbi:MAG: hypothetical protein C0401_00325 [Anaerolinea sp.]|nr:hypothetical protein [Anaerolinea sp.]
MSVQKNDLDPNLYQRLKDLPQIPARNPERAADGRVNFLKEAKSISNNTVSKNSLQRHSNWKISFFKEFKMGTIATLLVILGLVFGGSTATVYASQDALPNEVLYPVKLVTEGLQSNLASTAEAKMNLALDFAAVRVDEIMQMQEAGLIPPDAVFANLQMQINQAIEQATKLGSGELEQALLRIREKLQVQEQLMGNDLQDPILLRTRTLLQERIQLVESGIGNLNGFYNEAQNGWDNTPIMGESTPGQMNGQQENNPSGESNSPTQDSGNQPENGNGTGGTSTQQVQNGSGYGPSPTPKAGSGSGQGKP